MRTEKESGCCFSNHETVTVGEWLDKFGAAQAVYEESWRASGGTEWSAEGVEEMARHLYEAEPKPFAPSVFDAVNWREIAEVWNIEIESEG